MKRIVFLAVCLMCGLFICSNALAQWKYEEYTNVLDGAAKPLSAGNILTVSDPLLAAPDSKPAVTAVHEINNIITLAFNESAQFGATRLPDNFSITVNTSISVIQAAGGTPATTTRSFTIAYDKNNPYKRSDIFYFTNGRAVNVQITGIVPSNISDNLAKSIAVLTNDMRIDRSYTTDCAGCGVGGFNNYPKAINDNSDALLVSWPANKWAKAYDLEWTYISNEAYADGRYGKAGSAAFAQNVFRNNATRITISELSYKIPLLFNSNGYVFFRYRAVQQLPGGDRLTSRWSPEYNLTGGLGQASFIGHQGNLTWQASSSFAEEGKLKSVVQYYDGTLRGRQTVTKDNVTNTAVIAESLYDHQGRPVISVLPAPTLNSVIQFTPLATTKLNAPGSEYVKDLYDGLAASNNYCDAAAPGMGTDAGASGYYSPNNPLKQQGFNRYIPDAEKFPFSETKYTQDNTGRIVAQGGVGEAFKLGAKDTRYLYASPSQTDLDALFGTDAGDAAHYEKNMVRDANGQYSVSYVDMKGRTVATALAGAAPDNVAALGSYPTSTTTETLLTPVNNMVKGNSVAFSRTIVVPKNAPGSQNSYKFIYSLNPQTLRLANWAGNNVCYDCLYDLTITITDECNNKNMPGGVPYVYKKSNFSLNGINSNCSDPARGISESFSLSLPEGTYTVTKELSVSQAGKEYYRENIYMPNNFKTTFENIYSQQMQLVKQQLGDCNNNGAITKTDYDEVNEYADRMYAQMTGNGVYAQAFKHIYKLYSAVGNAAMLKDQMLRRHPEYQVYINYSQLVQSNKWDDAMSKVNTYRQAVQSGYLNPLQMTGAPASAFPGSNPDPLFLNNAIYKARMTDSLNRAMITRVSTISGRPIPVEWASLWSLSNMLVKCGVQADGAMDAACITRYLNTANVYNASLLCATELDEAWMKFKAIYLAKKKLMASDFMFAQGYPVVNESDRLFIDPRRYFNQQELGINPYADAATLQLQARQKLAGVIDQNCRNYAAYWWNKLDKAGCGFLKARDSAAIVDRLIAVCKEGGDESHPFGAGTVKPSSTYAFKSFNETIIDYMRKTPGVSQDVTLCNGALIDAPGPYERPFISVNKTINSKPGDCECGNIQGLYQVYQTRYSSKYSSMSAFMQAVYKTTITDGALDTLRRMCKDEFKCGPASGGLFVVLPPALQCGNVQTVCADCEKVNNAYTVFKKLYASVIPTKNDDTARKNTFFAGFINDRTGLYKTATEYLDFINLCNTTEGSYPGSFESNTCTNDIITVQSTGVPRPSNISFRYTDQFPFLQIQQVKGLYIPGISTFFTQPDYYAGVPAYNGAPLSEGEESEQNDFWSNQNYLNQDVRGLVSGMYGNMLSTGVNYPVQYKLNIETDGKDSIYKKFQFGGTEAADHSRRPVLKVSYSASRCEVFAAFVNNALGTYLNLSEIKALYSQKGKMAINENCTAFAGSGDCGLTVKVYKSDLLLCGANTEPTFIPLPESILPNACKDSVAMAWAATQEIYNFRRDSLLGNFDNAYTQKCLSAADFEALTMTVTNQVGEYHYTLYYYDQAGNLVKTVPPKGVVVNRDPVWLAEVKQKRATGQSKTPDHTLYTMYRYNSLNQVISQYSPDGGQTNFWYDRLGRLAVSRNAGQKKTNSYSYTLYDDLGRIREVGQKQQPNGITDATARNTDLLKGWVNLNNTAYPHKQVTRTVYDLPAGISQVYTSFSQKAYTLRNRVSYMQFFAQLQYNNKNEPDYLNHTQATYYDYDIHGNVSTLLHDYANGAMASNGYNRFKMVAYNYDLVSGKVNLVSYQPGKQDEMYHRYAYDAENRITDVYTTHRRAFVGDRNVEERDANYSYYRHGPLARTELGNNKVQGLDYAYTLQGWLKGVNSTALNPSFDMGEDGKIATSLTARDAIGFSLNYYMGDYKNIEATKLPFAEAGGSLPGYKPLYNGNISHMSVGIKGMETMLYSYGYDQLHRLVKMNAFNGFNSSNNQWNNPTPAGKYGETIAYDGNGNILTYNRDGDKAGAELPMDRLHYNYITGTNKLDHITDDVTDGARYTTDIDGQAAGNYDYDAIGNLTKDTKEKIRKIEWTVYGKIRRIEKTDGVNIDYTYDVAGNRISKTLSGTGVTGGPATTWYVRDAQGNTLTTYTLKASGITADEQYVYGSSRLGVKNRNLALNSSLNIASATVPGIGTVYNDEMMRGKTQYELSNHLGNVLATISDRKVPHITGNTVDYYEAQVVSAQDYYPFGMLQPGRSYNAGGYRFGFNGKEQENDVKGFGGQQDYGMRIYDPRVGRFLSVDPITRQYPELTPYQFASNTPVQAMDLDGLEAYIATETIGTGHAFLVVKTAEELVVYTYGRFGDVNWNQTSGEGILIRMSGAKAIEYINTELTRMDAKFFKAGDVSASNIKNIIDAEFNAGSVSKVEGVEGKVIDEYSLFSSNCSTHSCDWLIDAGTAIFNESTLGVEYKEDFVIPSSLQSYLNEEVKGGKKSLSDANEEIKQIVVDETAKQKLQGAGRMAESSGSSGRSSGGATNSSSSGSSSGRNTSSGSGLGSTLGSSSSGQVGSSSGASSGSSSGNGHSSSGSSFSKKGS